MLYINNHGFSTNVKPSPQKPSYKGKHPFLGITCKQIFGTEWIQQSSLGITITSLEKCYKKS
jgi:hypothetical protein